MTKLSIQTLEGIRILTVPGLDGSGPHHWQSLWEIKLDDCHRVQMGDWAYPNRSKWVDRLDEEINRSNRPVLLAAHSLGCFAVAWWARERWSWKMHGRVAGALLVAPPDVERPDASDRIKSFSPAPDSQLPFRSLLVASRDDHYASFEASQHMAGKWNSQFVDAGYAGHLNADSGLRHWPDGLRLLASLAQAQRRDGSAIAWPIPSPRPLPKAIVTS